MRRQSNLTTQEIGTIAPLDLFIKRGGVDYITLTDGQIQFNQPTNISIDVSNLVKKTGEADQRIDGTVSINGDTTTGYELTVNGQVHTQGMYLALNTNLIFGSATRYIINPVATNHIRHYCDTTGEHQFYCGNDEDFLIDKDKVLARGNVLCVGQFQGSIFNSFNNDTVDVSFRKTNVEYIKLGGALSMVELPRGLRSDTYNTMGNVDATFRRNSVDFFYLRNNTVDLNSGISLSADGATINEISSKPSSNLVIQRAGINYITLTDGQIQFNQPTNLATGGDTSNCVKCTGETLQTIEGDLVIGAGAQFGSFNLTVNGSAYFLSGIELVLGGTVVLGTGKGYIRSINIGSGNTGYDYCIFASGGLNRFYVGGSPFPQHLKFQLSTTQAYLNVDVVCHTELQTDVINTKNATDVDLVFKRGDVEYMKFEGTLQAVELTKGAKSNTYDSIGNVDVSFRRNTIDFRYFRNGNVEVNTGISLLAESGKFDVIDSATPTNVVFKRGGVNFFTLDGTKNIIDVSTGRALSSQYIYGDYFYNRNYGADMVFQGSNTTDDGLAEYMRYRKADEDVNFSKDIYVNQDKKAYFHKETGKNSYIFNENTAAGVNHFKLYNEDPNGDIRFYAHGSVRLFVTPSKVSVPAPYTLEGDLIDTSSEKVKYDIKEAEYDFTSIVKNIKPKTFKLNKEKEANIYKNHIGFIAETIEENVPTEIQNVVCEVDGIKSLNYVKSNTMLWECVQQQQSKIEHLEATMFEMMEEIKELKGKKKPKAKAEN